MKLSKKIFMICLLSLLFSSISRADLNVETGAPIKFIEGCQDDFDNNGFDDIAILIQAKGKTLLMAMMKKEMTYSGHALFSSDSDYLRLRCEYRTELLETRAGKGNEEANKVPVNGKVIIIYQPEASSVAFYWKEGEFRMLWLSD